MFGKDKAKASKELIQLEKTKLKLRNTANNLMTVKESFNFILNSLIKNLEKILYIVEFPEYPKKDFSDFYIVKKYLDKTIEYQSSIESFSSMPHLLILDVTKEELERTTKDIIVTSDSHSNTDDSNKIHLEIKKSVKDMVKDIKAMIYRANYDISNMYTEAMDKLTLNSLPTLISHNSILSNICTAYTTFRTYVTIIQNTLLHILLPVKNN